MQFVAAIARGKELLPQHKIHTLWALLPVLPSSIQQMHAMTHPVHAADCGAKCNLKTFPRSHCVEDPTQATHQTQAGQLRYYIPPEECQEHCPGGMHAFMNTHHFTHTHDTSTHTHTFMYQAVA